MNRQRFERQVQMRNGRPWHVVVRPLITAANLDQEPLIEDLIIELRRAIYQAVRDYNGWSRARIMDNVRGLIMAENVRNGQTHVYTTNRRITGNDLDLYVFEQVLQAIQQSNVILGVNDLMWHFIIDPRTLIAGNGNPKKLDWITKEYEDTWQNQVVGAQVINCAAYALAHAIVQRKKNKNEILMKALEIMNKFQWTVDVTPAQIEDFVKVYKEYRVSIVMNRLAAGSITYEGVDFNYTCKPNTRQPTLETSKKIIYLVFDMERKHYGGCKTPYKMFKRSWCHKCVYAYRAGTRCKCEECEPVFKRPKVRKCNWCQKLNCNGLSCSKNCKLCGVSVTPGYGKPHRCFVYSPQDEPEVFWKSGDPISEDGKGAYMLWAYDLESAIKRVDDVYDPVFQTDGEDFISTNGKYVTSCVNRAMHDVNMVVFRNVFDDNSEQVFFGPDALERFIIKMLTCNGGKNIAVAHNGSGYDTRLVFETAAKFEPLIKPIARGCKFLQLKVGKHTLFRDSLLHLPGGLAKLAKDFLGPAANMRKGHFPHLFNSEENYAYSGQIPAKEFFDMTFFAKSKADVDKFNEWYSTRSLERWDFMHELTEYCKNDVAILARLMKEYHDICFDKFKISPWFSATAPSYVHKVVKAMISTDEFLQLPDKDDKERYKARIQQLAEEEHWAVLRPGEYWFARLALRGGRTDARQLYYNLSPEDIAKGYEIRYQDIVSMYPYVQVAHQYPVGLPEICIWDLAVYPCSKHENPESGNIVSLSCNCDCRGKKYWRDEALNISLEIYQPTEEDILEDDTFFGIVCASLEPPKNLYHPVLVSWDSEANKCVASLEPIVFGVFTTPEFKKALSVGYKLTKLHRLDKYKYKDGLWNDFIKHLYIEKMANSEPIPDQETQNYLVEQYEEKFEMGDSVLESFPRWAKNSAKRQVFKIMLNSGWGKHCQRAIMGQVLMVGEEDDESIFSLFANVQENILKVNDLKDVGKLTMIRYEALGNTSPDLHDSYLPAGLFVPAYGRLQLYEYLEKLGKRVLYHDTDSIIYIYKPEEENIPSSDVWGAWSEEDISRNGNIQTFVSLGPKTYGIKTKTGETMIKAKGLSLKNSHRNILNFEKMEELIQKHMENQYPQIQVPQFSFTYTPGIGMYTNYFLKKFSFQPSVLKGHLHSDLRVYPPGFCKECMDDPEHCV